MKRRKRDPNKVYAFIVRAVVYSALYFSVLSGFVYSILECTTVYR